MQIPVYRLGSSGEFREFLCDCLLVKDEGDTVLLCLRKAGSEVVGG